MYNLIIKTDSKTDNIEIREELIDVCISLFPMGSFNEAKLEIKGSSDDVIFKIMTLINDTNINENFLKLIEEKIYSMGDCILEIDLEDYYINSGMEIDNFNKYIKSILENDKGMYDTTLNREINKNFKGIEINEDKSEEKLSKDEYFKAKKKKNLKEYNYNIATKTIIWINIVVYIYGIFFGLPNWMYLHPITPNANILKVALSLVTAGFIQFNFFHIFFNMYFLYYVGSLIEKFMGTKKFLIIYFFSMIVSSISVIMFAGNVITAGASGALYGLLGFLITYLILSKDRIESENERNIIIVTIVLNFSFTLISSNVSLIGHLSGFLAGIVMGIIIYFIETKKNN